MTTVILCILPIFIPISTLMCDSHDKGTLSCPIQTHLDSSRFALSTILSFLNECDGTSALITNKTWSRTVLPIYCIPLHLLLKQEADENKGNGSKHNAGCSKNCLHQKRHKFIVVPVQDPIVLLDRLNTIRLAKRRMIQIIRKQEEDHCCYPKCMTTAEIAWYEWNLFYEPPEEYEASSPPPPSSASKWPVTLELLRYRKPTIPPTLNLQAPPRPELLPGITLLASYPRSGNTLLRNLLERTLNIVTGSDTRPDRTLSKALAHQHNLVGEGIVCPSITPVVKTHFPERKGYKAYNASRVIVLVRNPYDAMDSYWNMCCTNTHTESVVEDVYERYTEKFRGLARSEIRTWMDFLRYWVIDDDRERNRLPTLIVRYEDLILQPKIVMEEVMKFLLYGDTPDERFLNPFWRRRVHHCLLDVVPNANPNTLLNDSGKRDIAGVRNDEGTSASNGNGGIDTMALGLYKPRPISEISIKLSNKCSKGEKSISSQTSERIETHSKRTNAKSSIGKSLKKDRYSDDTIRHIHDVANEESYRIGKGHNSTTLLYLFGYDILNQHFPLSFASGSGGDCLPSLLRGDPEAGTIKVNVGKEIRRPNDPFGRAMTSWRRGETNLDNDPFPTLRKGRSKS